MAQRPSIQSYYDRLASVYGEGEFFRARREVLLDAIHSELAGARRPLDLGCGNGAFLLGFAQMAPQAQIVGADLAPEMLAVAQRRIGDRAQLVRADGLALPFAVGCFDLVFMSHVLQLVGDTERCIAEVSRCLGARGLLIATIGTSGWRQSVMQLLGADALREIAGLVGSARSVEPGDDEARVSAACEHAGLQPSVRRVAFSVAWPAVDEWIRLRWLTIVDDTLRARAERWLADVGARAADRTLVIEETLLVARKR